MHLNIERSHIKYPFNVSGIYTSVIIAILSIVLATLLLRDLLHLLYYLLSTILITVVTFILKKNIFYPRLARLNKDHAKTSEGGKRTWMLLILIFLGLIATLILPLFLTKVLDPYVWLILIISFTTGVSVAEILLYLYMPKTFNERHDYKTKTV